MRSTPKVNLFFCAFLKVFSTWSAGHHLCAYLKAIWRSLIMLRHRLEVNMVMVREFLSGVVEIQYIFVFK